MRTALLIAASLLAVACSGREAEDERADASQSDGRDALAGQMSTAQDFTTRAAMSDMYEIASANIALEKAAGAPTREFAQMMVAEHTKSWQALKDAATQSGRTLTMPTQLDFERQGRIDILRSLNGEEFDREYMSQQMAAHRKALMLLKAYGGNGDVAELRQFAQSTIPAVQKHYDWLEQNSPSLSATGGMPAARMDATPAP
jgi:putative membrane protein